MTIKIRMVEVNKGTYLHRDQIAEYIREIAATEETDVRNRLLQAASNIGAIGQKCLTCGDPATRICDVRKGTFTCGLPLCSECVHEDACWKGVGATTTKKNGQPRG